MDMPETMNREGRRLAGRAGNRNRHLTLALESLEHLGISAQSLAIWMGSLVHAHQNYLRTLRSLEGRVSEQSDGGLLELRNVNVR
jgi:hypothetical protein